jgi:hypothetical protein
MIRTESRRRALKSVYCRQRHHQQSVITQFKWSKSTIFHFSGGNLADATEWGQELRKLDHINDLAAYYSLLADGAPRGIAVPVTAGATRDGDSWLFPEGWTPPPPPLDSADGGYVPSKTYQRTIHDSQLNEKARLIRSRPCRLQHIFCY